MAGKVPITFRPAGVNPSMDETPLAAANLGPLAGCATALVFICIIAAAFGAWRAVTAPPVEPTATPTSAVTIDAWSATGTAIAMITPTAIPSATYTPSPTNTPDAWSATGTAMALATATSTPTPTEDMSDLEGWGATGTAIFFLTQPPTPTPSPTNAPVVRPSNSGSTNNPPAPVAPQQQQIIVTRQVTLPGQTIYLTAPPVVTIIPIPIVMTATPVVEITPIWQPVIFAPARATNDNVIGWSRRPTNKGYIAELHSQYLYWLQPINTSDGSTRLAFKSIMQATSALGTVEISTDGSTWAGLYTIPNGESQQSFLLPPADALMIRLSWQTSGDLYDFWHIERLRVVSDVEPTEEPTEEPTDIPTDVPTNIPTDEPTDVPTDIPTEQPTEEMTEQPTDIPTEATPEQTEAAQ